MASGGRRPGAGRPRGSSKLDFEQRLWAGARCEELWREAWNKKIEAVRASRRHHYDAVIASLYEEESRRERELGRPLTLQERAAIRQTQYGSDPDFLEFHAQDTEKALKIDQGLLRSDIDHIRDDEEYDRLMKEADAVPAKSIHRVYVPKPQAEQPRIKQQVRDEVEERYSVAVSIGTIENCWKAFRRLKREIADD